jgi:hypothetical protein
MDVVYILGTGSVWDNNELRYSLRSLEANLTDLRRVFIVGEQPTWLTGVYTFPMADPTDEKWRNSYCKIRAACGIDVLDEEFLLFNDDFFLNKPIEGASFPYYFSGLLVRGSGSKQDLRLSPKGQTAGLLQSYGKKCFNFSLHCPIRYQKSKYLSMPFSDSLPGILSPRSFYCNYFEVPGKLRKDYLLGGSMTARRLNSLVADKEYFSIFSQFARSPVFRDWISARFPNPSRFEL